MASDKRELKPKQWFLDRVGKRVYSDSHGCDCDVCKSTILNGFIIRDELQANCLFDMQNDFASDGDYLNYRDEK